MDGACLAAVIGHVEKCVDEKKNKIIDEEILLDELAKLNQCAHFDTNHKNHKVRIIYQSDSTEIEYWECDFRRFWKVGPVIIETPTSVKSINEGGGGSLE